MKKTKITTEMIRLISKGSSKAEIFSALIEMFGLKYQNLISEMLHFEYEYLRGKYDPVKKIQSDLIQLMDIYTTKEEVLSELIKEHGTKNQDIIYKVLNQNYDELNRKYRKSNKIIHEDHGVDYTNFFNISEKSKLYKKDRENYRTSQEFCFEDETLTGVVEITRGKLFIEAYSYGNNRVLTALNFITVLNAFFEPTFVMALSQVLAKDIIQKFEENEFDDLTGTVNNGKIVIKKKKAYSNLVDNSDNAFLFNVFYNLDPDMINMTIVGNRIDNI
jgi:hypothetical protein